MSPSKATTDDLTALFEALYSQYYGMVLHLCTGFMKGHRETGQDLAQEVLINVWNALGRFAHQSSYKTWIYRIAVNTCLQAIRREKSRPQQPLTAADQPVEAPAPDDHAPDADQALYRAIGQLAEVDRLVIMLVLEGMGYDEIAQVTGLTAGTLRVKIHRIKQRLKKLMTSTMTTKGPAL